MAAKKKKKPAKVLAKRPTKNVGGRPQADAAKVAIGLRLLDADDPVGAVEQSGVSLATLYRRKAERDAARGGQAALSPPPPSKPSPAEPSATIVLPQGGAVSTRPDLLDLVRRILDARDPAARRELDDGLQVHVAGGESALAPWLARPLPADAEDVDPLTATTTSLTRLCSHLESLPPGHRQANAAATATATLAKAAEAIRRGRPIVESADELQARLEGLDADTLALIEDTTVAAEARAAKPRPGAPLGVCVTCAAPLAMPLGPAPS